ncbi:uncharacterized protein SAPINGB_P000131 [Magnusiomyces paraingens]|uniref:DNA mismatch repair protein MSH3 n=1 Tax=Magnusiomyces paraingens TaxID=2606893 RepID=A0A5E8AYK1_9ASCO|nr:uncharacterized protein SAPINGB_P000131 [Saprochaete ingens]VVT43754.1 unnamed protein product [Saprochaete ingens]
MASSPYFSGDNRTRKPFAKKKKSAQQTLVSAFFSKKKDAPPPIKSRSTSSEATEPTLKETSETSTTTTKTTTTTTIEQQSTNGSKRPRKQSNEAEISKKMRTESPNSKETSPQLPKEPLENKPHAPKQLSKPTRQTLELISSQRQEKFAYKTPRSTLGQPQNQQQEQEQEHESEEQIAFKKARHDMFYAKLHKPGAIEVIKRKGAVETTTQQDNEVAEDADLDDTLDIDNSHKDYLSKFANKSTNKKSTTKKKLTPMNQQYVDLKSQHKDIILFIEIGYKYYLFGEDAQIASKELKIFFKAGKLTLDENDPQDAKYPTYAYTTILSTTIERNIKRLVDKGYKVGIVKQIETAAQKAYGKNKSAPFERKLTQVYTKSTMVDFFDMSKPSAPSEDGKTGYLMAITEAPNPPDSHSDNQHIGIVAVQALTGEIIYDDFIDSSVMHSELETRLLHLQPSEILVVGEVNKTTKKLLKQLAVSKSLSFEPRIETVKQLDINSSDDYINGFYNKKAIECNDDKVDDLLGQKLDLVDTFPGLVRICLAALMSYLKDFGLDVVFDLTHNFSPFNTKTHMHLNGNTITSLELFQNQTNFKVQGSLFHLLDYTRTPFGKRKLKQWISKPLIDRKMIENRIEAVNELRNQNSAGVGIIISSLNSLCDLERCLINIYYKRVSPRNLYYFLNNLRRVSDVFKTNPDSFDLTSEYLKNIFTTLPLAYDIVTEFLAEIDSDNATKDQKTDFFIENKPIYEDVSEKRVELIMVKERIAQYLEDEKKKLKIKSLKYIAVAGTPYYLNVARSEASKVPENWQKYSQTSAAGRYRSPELNDMVQEFNFLNDTIKMMSRTLFDQFLDRINVHYSTFRNVIHAIGDLDCYVSLLSIATLPHFVRPKFVDYACCNINQGRHPMVEYSALNNDKYTYVANNTKMTYDHDRAVIITGPNMGGKSSYVRQVALICIMAQIGCYVPADSAKLGIVDAVFTRMGAYDNMQAGESTFQVELKECSDILASATNRSLVLLDEIGRGTGTMDGVAIAHAVLEYFINTVKCLTLFVTHYPSLAELEERYTGVSNYHMGFLEEPNPNVPGESKIIFLYTLVRGVAHNSYGLNVARLAEIPESIIASAKKMADHLKEEVTLRQDLCLSTDMARFICECKDTQKQKFSDDDWKVVYRLFSNV